jgi:hypothetical protein
MLDRHGPNIVFSRDVDPEVVIRFIDDTFDLTASTAGFPLPPVPGARHAELR